MLWPFEYFSPESKEDVTKLLCEMKDVKILAGGTDLLVDMRNGVQRPAGVIDIRKIDALNELKLSGRGGGFIGARVNLNRIIEDKNMVWDCVRESALAIATYQIRNRATVAGNLCNASPASDCAPPLLVLEASVRVRGEDGGEFPVPLKDFFTGVKKNALKKGQWVVGVDVPPHPASLRSAFMKKQRIRGHDLSQAGVAGCLNPDEKKLRIAVGACAPTPLLFDFDNLYRDESSRKSLTGAVQDEVSRKITPVSDVRSRAEYRTEMVRLFLERIIEKIYA